MADRNPFFAVRPDSPVSAGLVFLVGALMAGVIVGGVALLALAGAHR